MVSSFNLLSSRTEVQKHSKQHCGQQSAARSGARVCQYDDIHPEQLRNLKYSLSPRAILLIAADPSPASCLFHCHGRHRRPHDALFGFDIEPLGASSVSSHRTTLLRGRRPARRRRRARKRRDPLAGRVAEQRRLCIIFHAVSSAVEANL